MKPNSSDPHTHKHIHTHTHTHCFMREQPTLRPHSIWRRWQSRAPSARGVGKGRGGALAKNYVVAYGNVGGHSRRSVGAEPVHGVADESCQQDAPAPQRMQATMRSPQATLRGRTREKCLGGLRRGHHWSHRRTGACQPCDGLGTRAPMRPVALPWRCRRRDHLVGMIHERTRPPGGAAPTNESSTAGRRVQSPSSDCTGRAARPPPHDGPRAANLRAQSRRARCARADQRGRTAVLQH
jgi:hypothetical protein